MNLKPFTLSVVCFIAVKLIAHLVAPAGYLWTENSISELASQGHQYKWVLQAGLIGYGLSLIWIVSLAFYRGKKIIVHLLPIALYGVAIFLSGVYCAAPIDQTITYSNQEARLHSTFATLAGISLSLGILWRTVDAPSMREKRLHFIFLFLVIGLSAAFGFAEGGGIGLGKGSVQRLLYLAGFAWLIYQETQTLKQPLTLLWEIN